MFVLSPDEVVSAARDFGNAKARYPISKTLLLGFVGGVFIAMGGALSLLISNGMPASTAGNPALKMLLAGITFPIGLILIVVAGGDLFTSNNTMLMPGAWMKDYAWGRVWRNWGLVYLSNFVGATLFAFLFVHLVGIFSKDPWHSAVIDVAELKTSYPFWKVLLKGIAANWLVCLGIWMGLSARTTSGKILGIWFPVMTFVSLGYEHSIANMFYIPLGMMEGANVTYYGFLIENLLPATIGNIIGGALMVGTLYTFAYLKKH